RDRARRAGRRRARLAVEQGELAEQVAPRADRERRLRAARRADDDLDEAAGQHVEEVTDVSLDEQDRVILEAHRRTRLQQRDPLRVGQLRDEAALRPRLLASADHGRPPGLRMHGWGGRRVYRGSHTIDFARSHALIAGSALPVQRNSHYRLCLGSVEECRKRGREIRPYPAAGVPRSPARRNPAARCAWHSSLMSRSTAPARCRTVTTFSGGCGTWWS